MSKINSLVEIDEKILSRIRSILDKKYIYDSKLRFNAERQLMLNDKQKIRQFYDPGQMLDNIELEIKVAESLKSYEAFFRKSTAIYNDFKDDILSWHPHFKNVIEHFVNFLWRKGTSLKDIRSFTYNEPELQLNLTPFLKEFIKNSTNAEQINNAIILHIENTLKSDPNTVSTSYEVILNNIKNKICDTNCNLTFLFDQQNIRLMIDEESQLYISNALRKYLNLWYPTKLTENERTIEYLLILKNSSNETALKTMVINESFFNSESDKNWRDFLSEMMVEFVSKDFKEDQNMILEACKSRKIDENFEMNMICDMSKLENLIKAEVRKLFDP